LYSSEIIIRRNVLDDCSFDLNIRPPITMRFHDLQQRPAKDLGPRRILIEDNSFVDCPTPEVGLYSSRDVLLRGNVARRDGQERPIKVQQQNTEQVIVEP
jgi:hypothetical protein